MEHKAFTTKADGLVREIRTLAGVFPVATGDLVIPASIDSFQAIWDTGATNTAIASSVVTKLGLLPISFTQVATGGGTVTARVYLLNLVLPNNVVITGVQATELENLNNCDLLIGMDIISKGDFALTHVGGKACFSFRMPSFRQIDFIPESNAFNRLVVHSKVNKGAKNLSKKRNRKVKKRR